MMEFDHRILSPEDLDVAIDIVGCNLPHPDVVLMPDGTPYLYRWHVVFNNAFGNVFFHVQVKSDPERPLHDHPWANHSVILSGGYDELFATPDDFHVMAMHHCIQTRQLRKGDVVSREAKIAHRLILPPAIPYTMTLFSTGPKVKEWGFWYPDGWHHNKRHVRDREDGTSLGHHEAA